FRFTGLPAREYFPESQTKFFSSEMSSQFSFDSDADGHVTGLVLHQSGMEQGAPRITVEDAKAVEDGLTARIKGNTPSPGSEAALRHQLAAVETGEFDYAAFSPELAALVRSQALAASQRFAALGALKSLTFKSVSQRGFDVYDAVFEHGELNCWIWPLADGKIKGFRYLAASQAP
ncbi:MAG TPA: hypothetical protein VHZ32_14015, partial [Rhizomicrobium sp.]|nr:hypothetical protein [Rhizomicrobium sp.]